jgi:hypothetical protein
MISIVLRKETSLSTKTDRGEGRGIAEPPAEEVRRQEGRRARRWNLEKSVVSYER